MLCSRLLLGRRKTQNEIERRSKPREARYAVAKLLECSKGGKQSSNIKSSDKNLEALYKNKSAPPVDSLSSFEAFPEIDLPIGKCFERCDVNGASTQLKACPAEHTEMNNERDLARFIYDLRLRSL